MYEITFGLRQGHDAGSLAIRWGTAGPFSHVDVRDPQNGGWWGARSDRFRGASRDGYRYDISPGFRWRPSFYDRDPTLLFTIKVLPHQAHAFWKVVQKQLKGVPYDWLAILAFAFPSIPIRRDWRRLNRTFCSEATAYACEKAGIFEPIFEQVTKITPTELALMLIARGAKVTRYVQH